MKNNARRCYRHARLETVIKAAQAETADDTPAMHEMVVRFEPLAKKLAHRMTTDPFLRDDLVNAARYSVVRAVRKHKPGTPGFASFAARYMSGAIMRTFKQLVPPIATKIKSIDDLATDIVAPIDVLEKVEDEVAPFGGGAVASIVIELHPEQQRLVERRYVDDWSMAEIAAEAGTSLPAVSQRFATIHRIVDRQLAA
jgi:RNA polymerase sigma factor (sigma-70 family)